MIRGFKLFGPRGRPGTNGTNGTNGAPGTNGTNGVGASPGSPTSRTLVMGTVYQATDPAKAAFVTANIDTSLSAIVGALNNVVELRIGSSSAGLAAGTSGFPVARTRTGITGLLAVVGLLLGTGDSLTSLLPVGWFFCVRQATGSGSTISSAFDQSLS